jgi:hypothetical protein
VRRAREDVGSVERDESDACGDHGRRGLPGAGGLGAGAETQREANDIFSQQCQLSALQLRLSELRF